MDYPNIKHLYKYYSYNANALSVLINRHVWYSKPATLNDPLDLSIDFIKRISSYDFDYMIEVCKQQPGLSQEYMSELDKTHELEKRQQSPKIRDESWEVANNKFRQDIKNSGVFCMSEKNDSMLMWSHYSNCHTGFCVEFVRSPENTLGDTEITNPVIYNYDYPKPNPFSDEGRKKCFDLIFLTKSIEWCYEKEWRIVNEEGDILLPLPGNISSVIFGLNMPYGNKVTIRNILAGDGNICFRQVEKTTDSFKLRVVEYAFTDSKK
jgi:hypothetical protein